MIAPRHRQITSLCRIAAALAVAAVALLPVSAQPASGTPITRVAPHSEWRNALLPAEPGPEALTLAEGGTARYTILLAASPTSQEEKAAADLGLWLAEMTGVTFAVEREGAYTPSGHEISLGRTALLAQAKPEGVDTELGPEGYGIAVRDGALYLWGGDGRGVINAVYTLLEEDLGCRWYHRDSATIPQRPTLTFSPAPRTYTPVLEIRDPFYWDAFHADWSLRNRTNAPSANVPDEWGGHVNYAAGLFVHTYNRLVPPEKYFAEHPEYYSEIDGTRVARQLCVTNPEVIEIAKQSVLEALRSDPNAELLSVSPNDGTGYCDCERCRALDEAEGSKAASALEFVNAMADAVRDEFPRVKISTLAYLDTVKPPKTIRPRDNVVIRLCTDRHAWAHEFQFLTETQECQEALKTWADIGAKIHIWDYTVNFSHYSIPMPNMPIVSQNIRFLMDHNVNGIMLQGAYQSPGSARGPMRCWVWAKQLWDPSLNTRELMRDFTYGFYGEAAPPMAEYDELLWSTWELCHMTALRRTGGIRYPPTAEFLTAEFIASASALFERAEDMASNEETLRRVQLAKLPVLYLKLWRNEEYAAEFEQVSSEFEAIARREGVTHLYEGGGANHVDELLGKWRSEVEARAAAPTP
ncbi:MAG TPA: DUF4838 domain-containing protein [Candidatus Hydrogenedentes bacterium]|nr:DUF4838 domain-containing protein [Candidatus Hydrogenedentota bacterium]HPG68024.1 DUF4838 domain-containing protein [Candidatus Hydrogenedentota bacterium]